jgi:hypothetical protein
VADPIEKLSREAHIFRLTLSYGSGGATNLVIVSADASIVYVMANDDYWANQFKSGEHKIYVQGYYDLLDNNIYLGHRVEDPTDW